MKHNILPHLSGQHILFPIQSPFVAHGFCLETLFRLHAPGLLFSGRILGHLSKIKRISVINVHILYTRNTVLTAHFFRITRKRSRCINNGLFCTLLEDRTGIVVVLQLKY